MNIIRYILLIGMFQFLISTSFADEVLTLEQIKLEAAAQSKYLNTQSKPVSKELPQADLETFETVIAPILGSSCLECHGPDKQKAKFRVDTLDPYMVDGEDTQWWIEALNVLGNGEMPPPDEEAELTDKDRAKMIDWLSEQTLLASQHKRSQTEHSSFRRLTRYEFSYALQDLLGLPYDLSGDLPPETVSEDGFQNSSEMLQMTAAQFDTYRTIARKALLASTYTGPQPDPVYFSITMDKAGPYYEGWLRDNIRKLEEEQRNGLAPDVNVQLHFDIIVSFKKALEQLSAPRRSQGGRRGATFINRETGVAWNRSFPYGFSLWNPTDQKPVDPEPQPYVMALPHGGSQQVDLGNHLPDRGMLKVRFRASRASAKGSSFPSLRLYFGYRPSNNSRLEYELSNEDIGVTAGPDQPQFYEWLIPLESLQRNPYLRKSRLGKRPNPSEYLVFRNVHQDSQYSEEATVHIDYIEVTAPFVTEWPPKSHRQIFPEQLMLGQEEINARSVLANFMPRAWRRPVTDDELNVRLSLFKKIRPNYSTFQDTMIEVLASVIGSPHFLYLSQSRGSIADHELASRLSFFLWSSQPDEVLWKAAADGSLTHPGELARQAERMLADPRADRFAQHFTHQWLGMDALEFLQVDEEAYPDYSDELKRSMQSEPIEFFRYVLKEDRSILDFLHADYAILNQILASSYDEDNVFGNQFQKVNLNPETNRGGLLVQPGLLAMNSDGKDSHPLKRGIWLLDNLLHDPPAPPPPSVPEIDLTDPEILKMTLKERLADHRNQAVCLSCHSKIDPWGIAFEEFDAIGDWREQINGKPVDATSFLYNQSELSGMDGLKRYLLTNRQDQFIRALVYKLASYALGRPLDFADRVEVEGITAKLRKKGDGLRTLILLLVESDLFRKS